MIVIQLMLQKPFMSLKCPNLLQVVVLITSLGVGAATIAPISAQPAPLNPSQLNPRPSIFNEPPYNRALAPSPGRHKHRGTKANRRPQPPGNRPGDTGGTNAPGVGGRPGDLGNGDRPPLRPQPPSPSGNGVPPAPPQRIDNALPGFPGGATLPPPN